MAITNKIMPISSNLELYSYFLNVRDNLTDNNTKNKYGKSNNHIILCF